MYFSLQNMFNNKSAVQNDLLCKFFIYALLYTFCYIMQFAFYTFLCSMQILEIRNARLCILMCSKVQVWWTLQIYIVTS